MLIFLDRGHLHIYVLCIILIAMSVYILIGLMLIFSWFKYFVGFALISVALHHQCFVLSNLRQAHMTEGSVHTFTPIDCRPWTTHSSHHCPWNAHSSKFSCKKQSIAQSFIRLKKSIENNTILKPKLGCFTLKQRKCTIHCFQCVG